MREHAMVFPQIAFNGAVLAMHNTNFFGPPEVWPNFEIILISLMYRFHNTYMSSLLQKISRLFFSSFDQTALITGTSDIMVVRWDSGQYHSTPFLVCFGHHAITAEKQRVRVLVNQKEIKNVHFTLDEYGYIHPMKPPQNLIQKLHLNYGRNVISFELNKDHSITSQIYLYEEHDKILVSDMDGTLTKNDIGGLVSNLRDQNYLHEGYDDLIQAVHQAGYKIVWLTMRSLPLYDFSKRYIQKHIKMEGALLTEPEEFFPAMKKEILRQTGNVKTNMMMTIRKLFPQHCNPFVGGLGNRENDAIAYRAAGIPLESIFIIDANSKVHHLLNCEEEISYKHMGANIDIYFPKTKLMKKNTMLTMVQEYSELEPPIFKQKYLYQSI